eukprot:9545801-Alexandrium_andersonii.AAC.1
MKDSQARFAKSPGAAHNLASEGVSRPGFRTSEGWRAVLPRGIAKPFNPDCRPSRLQREPPSQLPSPASAP